ncbi:restriction endonuclease subunit S [Brachybacterium paraconglomeratum]|uniref:restriction endonuclease subunit S n=1 Tax=Brachybacterium paraconglomeratum TaxID=173362 RepID=UPI003FD2257E
MSEWKCLLISDLGKVVTGSTPPSRNPGWFGDSVPFVTPSDMTEVDRRPRPARWLSSEGRTGLRRRLVPSGSVAFVCIGATIGKVCLLPSESVTNQQINSVIPASETNSRFLYYLLRHNAPAIAQAASGAATPIINKSTFSNMSVRVPDKGTQDRIGEALGRLDDLIENNRRRIEVLEEIARAIYREWFVKFRYPGLEHMPMVDSALGPIPEGWEARRVRDIAEVVRGRSYRSAELVDDGGLPFVNLKCMARGGGFRRNGLKRYIGPYKEEQVVRAGDLVLAVTDLTQGREILARATLVPRLREGRGIISLDVAKVVPVDDAERLWIFAALGWSDTPDRLKEYANGSTVLHLSPTHVENAEILWAPEPARKRFISTIAPMIDEIEELSEYSGSLARIRDQLLPKLVTGQIDVSTLDLDALVTEKVA